MFSQSAFNLIGVCLPPSFLYPDMAPQQTCQSIKGISQQYEIDWYEMHSVM